MDTPFTPEISTAPIPESITYPDRSTGLVIFGIIQIILGLLTCLIIPFFLLTAVMSRKSMSGPLPVGQYVMGVTTYASLAIAFITLGIGSIRAQRWARALTLIFSWIGLIVGAVSVVMFTVVMPAGFSAAMHAAAATNADVPPMSRMFTSVLLTVMIVFAAFFLVALPAAFVIFYRRKDVEETCKRRDPIERWTDGCPLPVLAVSLVCGCAALYFAVMSFTVPVIPFFGKFLTGYRGGAVCLAVAILNGFLAIFLYRVKMAAWWIALLGVTLRAVSATFTYLRADLMDAYSKMGMSQKQLEMLSTNPGFRPGVLIWSSLVFTLILLGYLIWIRRYFVHEIPAGPAGPELLSEPSPAAPYGS